MNYQSIGNYDGTLSGKQSQSYDSTLYGKPEWRGIEYDWEVPENQVVGSPGGVSTIHHHPTHGFYGRGNMSSDIYAGQGERYNSGVYGNLYQTGQESSQVYYGNPPPDYQYWQNQEPAQYSLTHGESSTWVPSMKMYGAPGSFETTPVESQYQESPQKKSPDSVTDNSQKENYITKTFEGDDGFELLDSGPTTQTSDENKKEEIETEISELCVGSTVKPWILFLFLVMTFVVVGFWAESSFLFVRQRFHGGRDPTWQRAVLYSIVVTIVFGIIVWIAGFPIGTVS